MRGHGSDLTHNTGASFSMRQRMTTMAVLALALLGACKDPVIPDYNNPVAGGPITSQAQLQMQAAGLLAGDRANHGFEILILETMARDAYLIQGAEPRYISNPLGPKIDPSNFIGSGIFTAQYRTIRGANELISGITGTGLLSAADSAATVGFAQTIKALEYMRLIETRDTIGVPILTPDASLTSLDPFRCKGDVLAYTSAVLDSGAAMLRAAGSTFPFDLTEGFAGFDTPDSFLKFNRALAAKVLVERAYRKYAADTTTMANINQTLLDSAQTALNESFFSTNPDSLRVGPRHTYSAAAGETQNPNVGSAIRVNPKVVSQAAAGDARLSKVQPCDVISVEGASSGYCFTHVTSPTDPLPILLDAELVVLQAKIDWGKGSFAQALTDINVLRTNEGGLAPLTIADFGGALTVTQQRAELWRILQEERYSLLFESPAYFVELRMLGFFTPAYVGLERATAEGAPPGGYLGQSVLPIPLNETNARGGTSNIQYATCQNS